MRTPLPLIYFPLNSTVGRPKNFICFAKALLSLTKNTNVQIVIVIMQDIKDRIGIIDEALHLRKTTIVNYQENKLQTNKSLRSIRLNHTVDCNQYYTVNGVFCNCPLADL